MRLLQCDGFYQTVSTGAIRLQSPGPRCARPDGAHGGTDYQYLPRFSQAGRRYTDLRDVWRQNTVVAGEHLDLLLTARIRRRAGAGACRERHPIGFGSDAAQASGDNERRRDRAACNIAGAIVK